MTAISEDIEDADKSGQKKSFSALENDNVEVELRRERD